MRLDVDAKEPLPFMKPEGGATPDEQEAEFSLLGKLNRLSGIDYPDDKALRARIKSYELAFGMQTAVPETVGLERETVATRIGRRFVVTGSGSVGLGSKGQGLA